ncbi:unnamed protein product [Blepharisma stoltei]|uniref:Ion transport domain-containing protein n=1 Tax=Blepharisma stoltei TaxID=1481888 RepID=A0AAU9IXA0_9CILI|nr:unnamed protein product [Blepharisma stoltei]
MERTISPYSHMSELESEEISGDYYKANEKRPSEKSKNVNKLRKVPNDGDYRNDTFSSAYSSRPSTTQFQALVLDSSFNETIYTPKRQSIEPCALHRSFLERIDEDNGLNKKLFSASNTFRSFKTLSINQPEVNTHDPELLKGYIRIRELTPFEVIEDMNDDFPWLDLRKAFLRVCYAISQFCLHIVSNPAFDIIILCFIFANTIVLSIEDPSANIQPPSLAALDSIFLYVYTAEAGLKILAYGFIFNKGAYIRDPWNILDALIISTAWASMHATTSINLNALRSLRILRPLKSISSLPGLRVLVLALLKSILPLSNIILILFFVLLIFGIIGNQLFGGLFKYQCMDLETGRFHMAPGDDEVCGSRSCPWGYECVKSLNNPVYGKINFDNALIGLLQCYTSISEEGWTQIMIMGEKAFNQPIAVIFSISLIFIGTFLLLNIMEVVLYSNFSKEMDNLRLEQKKGNIIEEESAGSSLIENLVRDHDSFEQGINNCINADKTGSELGVNSDEIYKYKNPETNRSQLEDDKILFSSNKKLKMHGIYKQAKLSMRNKVTEFFEVFNSMDSSIKLNDEDLLVKDLDESLPSPKWDKSKRESAGEQNTSINHGEEIFLKAGAAAPPKPSIGNSPSATYETKQESFSKKDSVLSRMASLFKNSTKRETASKVSEKAISPILTRVKNVKIRKDLAQKLKHVKETTKIKVCIEENHEITSNSIRDVFPEDFISHDRIHIESLYEYRFTYRGGKDVLSNLEKLTQTWDNKVSDVLDKYSEKGDRNEIFRYLCSKLKIRVAFYMTTIEVPKIIKAIKEQDKVTKNVVGDWSGYDVNTNDGLKTHEYKEQMDTMTYKLWSNGFIGNWQRLVHPFKRIVRHRRFNYAMILCVIANTITLSINHYGIDSETDTILTIINSIFTFTFVGEMTLKILALGLISYCREAMNLFDGSITILGLIEFLFLSDTGNSFQALRAIRILRIFRVVRVLRLFRYLQTMTHIIKKLQKNIMNFFYLIIFLSLFILIFTIVGLQLYSGKLNFTEAHNQYNWNNFYFSFLTTFQIMTEENWNNEVYLTMRSTYGYVGALFPSIWIMVGNYILLNIFLALVLDIFSTEEEDLSWQTTGSYTNESRRESIFSISSRIKKKKEQKLKILEDLSEIESESESESENENSNLNEEERKRSLDELKRQSEMKKIKTMFVGIDCERSFFVLSKQNKIRKLCYTLTSSPKYEALVLVVIIVSTLKLIWDTYLLDLPSDSTEIVVSTYFDLVFTVIFGVEMVIKSISMGFLFSKGSYLRDSWCQLDFIIVVLSVIDQALTSVNIPVIKVLRLLRILRPLRIISHNLQMKIMINALIESLISVFNVSAAILLLWLIFSILGVSLFGGKLYSCSNSSINNRADCEKLGYTWDVMDFNFDDVPNGMVDSFILTTQEGWPDWMYQTCAAYKTDHAPISGYYPSAAIYFIIHMSLSSIFFINLLIGVMFEKFAEAKKNESSIAALVLSKEQMVWVEIQSLIAQSKPQIDQSKKPENNFQKFFYAIQDHWSFKIFISICIGCNFILMCMYYDQASAEYTSVLENFNSAFTYIFIAEGAVKITGMGYLYFYDGWNRFDFFVIIASIIDLIFTYIITSGIPLLKTAPQLIRTIRVLRVTRVIRLVKQFNTLQELITLVSYSIPSILNVSSILLLIYVIYAVLGVYLYHSIDSGNNFSSYDNMNNFGRAIIKLFKHSTGENWPDAMFDCAKSSSGRVIAYLYWCTFISATTFVLLNVFVMVILQDYEDFANDAQSGVIIFNKDVKQFKTAWATYSATSQGLRIHYKFLVELMYSLGPELGVPSDTPHERVVKLLSIMELHIDDEGYIYYNDMLFSVMKRKHAKDLAKHLDAKSQKLIRKEEHQTSKRLQQMREKISMNFYSEMRTNSQVKMKGKTNLFFAMIYAKTVFRSWRRWTKKKKEDANKSGDLSITPRFSDVEFPGDNSLLSSEAEII